MLSCLHRCATIPPGFEMCMLCCSAVRLLVQKGLMSLDELRRATEALPGGNEGGELTVRAGVPPVLSKLTASWHHAALGCSEESSHAMHPVDLCSVFLLHCQCHHARPAVQATTDCYASMPLTSLQADCQSLFGNPSLLSRLCCCRRAMHPRLRQHGLLHKM